MTTRSRGRSLWRKARLTGEILAQYAPLLRSMRRDDLETAVAVARAAPRTLPAGPRPDEHAAALRLGSSVRRVLAVLPTDSRCLIQSLVLVRVLARRGIGAELVIGVQDGALFAAHAWVEHDRRPLLPPGDFRVLTRL